MWFVGQNQPKPNTGQTIKRSQMVFGNIWLRLRIPFQSWPTEQHRPFQIDPPPPSWPTTAGNTYFLIKMFLLHNASPTIPHSQMVIPHPQMPHPKCFIHNYTFTTLHPQFLIYNSSFTSSHPQFLISKFLIWTSHPNSNSFAKGDPKKRTKLKSITWPGGWRATL